MRIFESNLSGKSFYTILLLFFLNCMFNLNNNEHAEVKKYGPLYVADTLAVREILDANGLYDCPIQNVATFDRDTFNSRIIKLTLIDTIWVSRYKQSQYPKVNMSHKLNVLPSAIGKLSELTELYLNSNLLTSLPIELCNLHKLEILHLDNNRLSELPEDICQLSNLIELGLYKNSLSRIPDNLLSAFPDIKKLTLQYNQLTTINITGTKIGAFYVRYNMLCNVSPEVYDWMKKTDGITSPDGNGLVTQSCPLSLHITRPYTITYSTSHFPVIDSTFDSTRIYYKKNLYLPYDNDALAIQNIDSIVNNIPEISDIWYFSNIYPLHRGGLNDEDEQNVIGEIWVRLTNENILLKKFSFFKIKLAHGAWTDPTCIGLGRHFNFQQ